MKDNAGYLASPVGVKGGENLLCLTKMVSDAVKASHTNMQRYYTHWDKYWNLYKTRRPMTKEEADAIAKGRLGRVLLPTTYTQVESLVTFIFSLLTQKERLFEFAAVGDEDQPTKEVAELLLQTNFRSVNGYTMLPSLLRDFAIFGIAVTKDWWAVTTEAVPVVREVSPATMEGEIQTREATTEVAFEQVIVSELNQLQQVSPYNFFPDPSVPLYEWTKGRYVVTESEISPDALKQSDFYKNTERVVPRNAATSAFRDLSRTTVTEKDAAKTGDGRHRRQATNVVLSEWVGWLVPSNYKSPFEDNKPLGPEEFEVKYVVVLANDNTVVRATPYTDAGRQWPVSAAVYAPNFVDDDDMDAPPRATESLNNATNWFLTARGVSVGRTLRPRMVIDPVGVDPASIRNEGEHVILNRSVSGLGRIDQYVSPLPFSDTTQGHLGDASVLNDMSNSSIGISDAQLGQIASGRRSATEMSNVTQAAASRSKLAASMFWEGLLAPTGQRWLSRFRQSISEEFFVLYTGESNKALYPIFRRDSKSIARANDHWLFDGILPSEKAYTARALQEIFSLLMSSPTAALTFNLSPVKVLRAMMELRGFGKMGQFALSEEEVQMALTQLQGVQQATKATNDTGTVPGTV